MRLIMIWVAAAFMICWAQEGRAALDLSSAAAEAGVRAQVSPWFFQGWGLFFLVVAIVVGLARNRRASIAVAGLIVALVVAHLYHVSLMVSSYWRAMEFLGAFSFIPGRYTHGLLSGWAPGGALAWLWSPVTYAFLHGDGSHLFGNCVALFVFGRTLAWRIGFARFLGFFAASAAASAFTHMAFDWGSGRTLVGASGSGFAIMAATMRFVPRTPDRLKALFWPDAGVRAVPLARVHEVFTEPRGQGYFLACMLLYPMGFIALLAGTAGNVAVAGHAGGFLFGLLALALFDRAAPAGAVVAEGGAGESGHESFWLTLLRIASIAFVLFGAVRGLFYYSMLIR